MYNCIKKNYKNLKVHILFKFVSLVILFVFLITMIEIKPLLILDHISQSLCYEGISCLSPFNIGKRVLSLIFIFEK